MEKWDYFSIWKKQVLQQMKINLHCSEKNLHLNTFLSEKGRLFLLATYASNWIIEACFKIFHVSLKQRELGS